MVEVHLYKRTVKRKRKKITSWYYWYYDENKNQIRKSCGQNGKPCLLKRDAKKFINSLDVEKIVKDEKKASTKDYIVTMYNADSMFLKRLSAKGFNLEKVTLLQKQARLKLFLEKFGNTEPRNLKITNIENWLLSFERSNSWRNAMLCTVREIFTVLYEQDAIDKMPLITNFKKQKISKRGILTKDEIEALFPSDKEKIKKIWCKDKEKFFVGYTFYTMCYCILSTGMRSGEARAIQKSQFIGDDTILLNASMNNNNERINALKKHTDENKKWRLVILSKRACQMLATLETKNENKTDFLFVHNNKPITRDVLVKRLKFALQNIGIDADLRHLDIHALRFTYNTIMKKEIPNEDLRLLLGHATETMTDYYNKSTLLEKLPSLLKNKEKIDDIW